MPRQPRSSWQRWWQHFADFVAMRFSTAFGCRKNVGQVSAENCVSPRSGRPSRRRPGATVARYWRHLYLTCAPRLSCAMLRDESGGTEFFLGGQAPALVTQSLRNRRPNYAFRSSRFSIPASRVAPCGRLSILREPISQPSSGCGVRPRTLFTRKAGSQPAIALHSMITAAAATTAGT